MYKKYLSFFVLLLIVGTIQAQETVIRGFSDVGATYSDSDEENSFFSLGQFDLYITSQVTDRLSFVGEVVFEAEDGFIVDVERVLARYQVNNFFSVVLGKHHTPIGFWNTAYHHGNLLQPTIRRPLPFLFEDEGGAFPIHTTGILFTGDNIGSLNFSYNIMIGNGLGSTPISDNDKGKSFTGSFFIEPVEGLKLGASGYVDKASAGIATLQGTEETPVVLAKDMDQQILTGSLVYFGTPIELITEYSVVRNKLNGGAVQSTTAFYVYGGYNVGDFTPYFRFDMMDYSKSEPYFKPVNTDEIIIGARYDFNFLSSLRLEFQRQTFPDLDVEINRLTTQLAFGF